jgi:glycosyltransferase involved in cell wall biosynthesis
MSADSALTIAVSTLGPRIEALRGWAFDPRVRYLVLWQQPGAPGPAWPANVSVRPLPERGVTRSRNAAIEHCTTPWLWFMDDDVQLPPASLDALLQALPRREPNEVLIVSLQAPDGRPLKQHADGRRYGRREILQVGTVQVVVHAGWVRGNGLRFPLRLGAGAPYPVCDEPVFLARALAAGARITHFGGVVVVHPDTSSGQGLARREQVRARALAFGAIFGFPLCLLASAVFGLRHARAIGRRWPWLFAYGRVD